jgi:uncharacterized membrane protein
LVLFSLLRRRCSRQSLLVYIAATTLLPHLIYQRLDIMLGCLLVMVCILEVRGFPKLAGFTLGAAIAFKVVPVLLVPAWAAWTIRRGCASRAL